jgi:hypothetical protein
MRLAASARLLAAAGALGFALSIATSCAFAEDFEAVTGSVSADYVRAKQTDGSFKPESYTFGKGGFYGSHVDDASIDKIGFLAVAHVMADALRRQNYVPGFDPKTTKLLIMVYWGTTAAPENASNSPVYQKANDDIQKIFAAGKGGMNGSGFSHGHFSGMSLEQSNDELDALSPVQAENRLRDKEDARNAALLGYNSWWNQFGEFDHAGTAVEHEHAAMVAELEEDRYFVVLMAYDFQLLQSKRQHKLLWDTRFSIREHRNRFDEKLPAMAVEASRFFGQDSKGLTHDALPAGHVGIGDLKNLGTVPEK